MTTVEALEGVRDLCGEGWTRAASFRVDDHLREVGMDEYLQARQQGRPHCLCVDAAFFTVLHQAGVVWPILAALSNGVDKALRKAFGQGADSRTVMNDALSTQEEALAWLSRAISIAREEESLNLPRDRAIALAREEEP